jgi:hypothetical protein
MTTYQTASPIVQESVGGDGLPNRGFLTAGILPEEALSWLDTVPLHPADSSAIPAEIRRFAAAISSILQALELAQVAASAALSDSADDLVRETCRAAYGRVMRSTQRLADERAAAAWDAVLFARERAI